MTENGKQMIRAEAITEFAERLKKYYSALNDKTEAFMVCYHIDVIAKEIIGGDSNDK